MNVYAIVVLATLAVRFVVGLITEILNLQAPRDELPAEFAGVYDAVAYKRSQDYTRAQTRFGFVTSSFDLAVTLVFWFCGGFNFLDGIVRRWNWNLSLANSHSSAFSTSHGPGFGEP